MKLVLTAPSSLAIEVSALEPSTGMSPARLRELVSTGLAPDQRVEVRATTQAASERAWPVWVVDAQVVGPAGPHEDRLAVIYTILQWVAVAMVRRPPGGLATIRSDAMPVLMSGKLDSAGDILALRDLLEP